MATTPRQFAYAHQLQDRVRTIATSRIDRETDLFVYGRPIAEVDPEKLAAQITARKAGDKETARRLNAELHAQRIADAHAAADAARAQAVTLVDAAIDTMNEAEIRGFITAAKTLVDAL